MEWGRSEQQAAPVRPFLEGEDYSTRLQCIFVKCLSGKHWPSAGSWEGPDPPPPAQRSPGLAVPPGGRGGLPQRRDPRTPGWKGRTRGGGLLSLYMLILFYCGSPYHMFQTHSISKGAESKPFSSPCGFTGTGVRTGVLTASLAVSLCVSLFK